MFSKPQNFMSLACFYSAGKFFASLVHGIIFIGY